MIFGEKTTLRHMIKYIVLTEAVQNVECIVKAESHNSFDTKSLIVVIQI